MKPRRVQVVIEFTDDGPIGWHAGDEVGAKVQELVEPVLGHLGLTVTSGVIV